MTTATRLSGISPQLQQLLEQALKRLAMIEFDSSVVSDALARRQSVITALAKPAVRDSLFGLGHRAGVHTAQTLGQQTESVEDFTAMLRGADAVEPPSVELIILLSLLGQVTVRLAAEILPPAVRKAAEEWKSADAERQRKICAEVLDALSDETLNPERVAAALARLKEHPTNGWLIDLLDQPLSRIFPREYNPANKGHPNCFAKGQMLTAFARLAGAEVLGVTPILTTHEYLAPCSERIGDSIAEFSTRTGIRLPQSLADALERDKGRRQLVEEAPNRFHMGAAVQLRDGSWYLLDPHMDTGGPLSAVTALSARHAAIEQLAPVLPGIAFLTFEPVIEETILEAVTLGEKMINAAHDLHVEWGRNGRSFYSIFPLLAASPAFLNVLADDFKFGPAEIAGLPAAQEIPPGGVVVVSMGQGKQMIAFRNRAEIPIPAESVRLFPLVAIVLDAFSDKQLGPAIARASVQFTASAISTAPGVSAQDEAAKITVEAMEKCLGRMVTCGYKAMLRRLGYAKAMVMNPHPTIEVYDPEFRIGVELIAHMNAIGPADNSVVMELAAVCGGQHHLVLAATETLRTNAPASALALRAQKLLDVQHFLLRDAEEALHLVGAAQQQTNERTLHEST